MTYIESAGTGRRDTDEIEITPEMIEAGADAVLRRIGGLTDPSWCPRELAESVYRAMEASSPMRYLPTL